MTTIQFFASLTGDNSSILSTCSPISRKKVIVLGTGMLIPVLIWFVNGFAIARNNFELGIIQSIFVALFCSTLVFLLERLIIMSNSGGKSITTVRIVAGILLAFIGSIFLDEILFEKDINKAIAEAKRNEISEIDSIKLVKLNSNPIYIKLFSDYKTEQMNANNLQEKVIQEMDGNSPGAKIGYGKRAKAKENLMQYSNERIAKMKLEIKEMEDSMRNEVEFEKANVQSNFSEKSLLTRIETFFGMVFSNWAMAIFWIAFFLLAFSFEIAIIL